jgi:amidohydrolase
MADLIELRHLLHQNPELAHREAGTYATLERVFADYKPDELLDFNDGGKGFLFKGKNNGPVSVFRAELDALPIDEINDMEYASAVPGVSHVCGHDGHMAILTGLGERISSNRPVAGDTMLLFQSGEETGTGADQVCRHPLFMGLKADHIFGLHNIPGLELHTVTTKPGVFSAGSTGMVIELKGKTSHAAEPENGINPDQAVAEIIRLVHALNLKKKQLQEITFATLIRIDLGEEAFGTSPGFARILITLRSLQKEGIPQLRSTLENEIRSICRDQDLSVEFSYKEVFPATVNSGEDSELVRQAALKNNLPYTELAEAYRWSEDFGYYLETISGCFFGLGAGVQQPALHNPDYDFPDRLIDSGVRMFFSIYKKLHLINE